MYIYIYIMKVMSPHGYYYHRNRFVAAHVLALGNMMYEKWSKLQTIYNTFYIYISKFEFEYLVISQSQCLTVIGRLREMVVWVLCFIMLFYLLASRGCFLVHLLCLMDIYIYMCVCVCVCVCVYVCLQERKHNTVLCDVLLYSFFPFFNNNFAGHIKM